MVNREPLNDVQSSAIIAAAIEVHRALGCGFPEPVYQEALAIELTERGVPFLREATLPVKYKGRLLRVSYRVDFVCHDRLLVELKATSQIALVDQAQMLSYLKAANAERGLILNFGGRSLAIKRLLFSAALHQAIPLVEELDAGTESA